MSLIITNVTRGGWSGLGHDARLSGSALVNQILRTCCLVRDAVTPCADWKHARGRTQSTWIHKIRQDTGVTVTEALDLVEER